MHKSSWLKPPLAFPSTHACREQFLPRMNAGGLLSQSGEEAKELLLKLAQRRGTSQSAVLELVMRRVAEREKLR